MTPQSSKARAATLVAAVLVVLAGAAWLSQRPDEYRPTAPATSVKASATNTAAQPTTELPTTASGDAPRMGTAETASFLARQARALRPGFEGQLAGLTEAPRYTVDASYDPVGPTIAGHLSLEYFNRTSRPLSDLVFRLLPNARTVYGGGGMSVEAVTVDGTEVEPAADADPTVLRIPLDRPLPPGGDTRVEMRFDANLPTDVARSKGYGIFNRSRGVTSLAGWLPMVAANRDGWRAPPVPAVGDAAVFETSLYEVRLAVPTGSNIVSTGQTIDVVARGDQDVWHMVSGPARDFTAAIGDFELIEHQVGGVQINSHYLEPSQGNTSAEESAQMVRDAFAVYIERFGPYPLRELDVVEANVPIGGYEFSGLVYLDHDLRVAKNRGRYRYIVGHEVAHQWWYYLVGNDSVLEPWLDESFVTYAAALYVEATDGAAAAEAMLDDWAGEYGPRDSAAPPLDSPATMFQDWVTYRTTTYYRGAQFLRELRESMGDESFFELLRRHQAENLHGLTSTEDFLELAEQKSDRDLGPLFARWFE